MPSRWVVANAAAIKSRSRATDEFRNIRTGEGLNYRGNAKQNNKRADCVKEQTRSLTLLAGHMAEQRRKPAIGASEEC
jgi:hypothetical protein